MKKEKWLLLGILLYLLINIAGLFVPIVINAAKYAQIGREMLDNENWINLTIGGDAYDQKPPLLFWIAALVLPGGLLLLAPKAYRAARDFRAQKRSRRVGPAGRH